MENFTPYLSLAGGLIIGISATILLTGGRIAGISGILGGLVPPVVSDLGWRVLFVLGLIGGAVLFPISGGDISYININPYNWSDNEHYIAMIIGGLLVGLGTNIGAGCTSGHGICGLGRLSARSLVATITFMVVAVITVFIIRTFLGA
ncbi:YeeE/YedE family protein [Sneathiella limimaris]|uniref:YeeE/YedE family protein n=1 Tax=Sneathiella limimaris TaxID=1964213 RepID=UPI00146D8CA1|nr:YeeE/YedE family protein [Sneathiella limimaris]